MKLTVLVDNNTMIDQYYLGEPAVSYHIQDGDMQLLFDVGYSDVFIHNAKSMGIELNDISTIAISHGHNDHTRGLIFLRNQIDLKKINMVAHPDAFKPRKEGDLDIGSPITLTELNSQTQLTLTKHPIKLTEHITFLGEIPNIHPFEQRENIGYICEHNHYQLDYVLDDSALVYQGNDGLFIITGCSHSGICNIIEYASQLCSDNRILGVIGGFHLLNVSDKLLKTIEYFKQKNITNLYPCHCVSFAAKAIIHKEIPITEVGVGMVIDFD